MDADERVLLGAVRDALAEAMLRQTCVRVYLRGDATRNMAMREYMGVPTCFIAGKSGSERVVLTVTAGETEQIIRIERIARVIFQNQDEPT